MVGLLLIVFALTTPRLNADPYWVDEVIAVQRAGLTEYETDRSLHAIWHRTAQVSDQVPAYYMLLANWATVTGNTPYSLRYLSLLIGIVLLALTYRFGTQLLNHQAGFAAALTLASSAFFLLFLHEMRMYALLLCLLMLMLGCYWQIRHGRATPLMQVGLVLSTALLLYTYYLSILMISALCAYHLCFVKKDRDWWRVVGLMALAGALFLPWFLTAFSVLDDTARNEIRQLFTRNRFEAIWNIITAFSNDNALLLGLLLIFALRLRDAAHRFVWFILVMTLALMLLVNDWFGVLVNLRYTLMLWVPLALATGLGAVQLAQRGIPFALITALIGIFGFGYALNPQVTAQYDLPIRYLPWDEVVATLTAYEREGDVMTMLVSIEGNDWEGVHEERVMPHYFYDSLVEPIFIEDVRNLPDAAMLQEIQGLTDSAERIWFAYPKKLPSWRNGIVTEFYRQQGFVNCGNFADSEQLYMDLYAHKRTFNNADSIRFGVGDASAELSLLSVIPLEANNTLTLIHGWRLSDTLPRHTYSLALHILTDGGELVQQADYGLPIESFDCVTTIIDLSNLDEGDYTVMAFVYAWEDGTRLPVQPQFKNIQSAILGQFHVNDISR